MLTWWNLVHLFQYGWIGFQKFYGGVPLRSLEDGSIETQPENKIKRTCLFICRHCLIWVCWIIDHWINWKRKKKNIWFDFGLLLVAKSVYRLQVTSRVLVLLQALVKKGWQCFRVVTCPCHDKHWTKQIFFPHIFWK